MEQWLSQVISLVVGLLGGATIGSLVTLKIVRSQTASGNGRAVQQRNITAGRDNIVGDIKDRR